MSWIAAVVGTSILSGGLGAAASQRAASQQADAARRGQDIQAGQFQQTRQDLQPWMQAGQTALSELQNRLPQLTKPFTLQDFQASPAYQFNLEQGKLALDKAAASRGKFYAPSTLQDIAKYSQGVASNEFQNAFSNYQTNMGNVWNRLYSLSGTGQNAAAQTGAFGTSVASDIARAQQGIGNAQAAGTVGTANAFTGAANNLLNFGLASQFLPQAQRSSVNAAGWMPTGGVTPEMMAG